MVQVHFTPIRRARQPARRIVTTGPLRTIFSRLSISGPHGLDRFASKTPSNLFLTKWWLWCIIDVSFGMDKPGALAAGGAKW